MAKGLWYVTAPAALDLVAPEAAAVMDGIDLVPVIMDDDMVGMDELLVGMAEADAALLREAATDDWLETCDEMTEAAELEAWAAVPPEMANWPE